MNRGGTMKFTKNVCVLSDDDLDQVCGGVDTDIDETVQFLVGLIVGPIMGIISNFTTPFYICGKDEKAISLGIAISNTITQLGILYLGYRGLKAIFSKSLPSCNAKDDKKIETDETKLKEQSACA